MSIGQCTRCGGADQLRRGLCHNCYERDRRRGLIDPMVSAEAAYRHIVLLRIAGWGYREMARAAGVNRSVIAWIVNGRTRIQAKTARAICQINPADRTRWRRYVWDTRRAKAARRSYEELAAQWAARAAPQHIPEPGRWTDDALCAQVDTDIFFPVKGGSTRDAKKVCLRCSVRQQCLDFALENNIGFGIFGGVSPQKRK